MATVFNNTHFPSDFSSHGDCFQKYTFPLGLFVSWQLLSTIHISPRTFCIMATVFNFSTIQPPPPPPPPGNTVSRQMLSTIQISPRTSCLMTTVFNNTHFPANFRLMATVFNNTNFPRTSCLMATVFNNTNFPSNFCVMAIVFNNTHFPSNTSYDSLCLIHCTGFERKKRGRALQFLNQLVRALTFPLFIRLRVFLRHSRKSLGSQMKFIF